MKPTDIFTALRGWGARRWWTALAGAAATVLAVAVPTDLIEIGLFTRAVPPPWWSWPVLAISAVLAGLVTASYVAPVPGAATGRAAGRIGAAGGMATFFAVGCPVCNKIVLLALGTTGALQFFAPIQPYLAAASIGLLLWALASRVGRENSCPVPPRTKKPGKHQHETVRENGDPAWEHP